MRARVSRVCARVSCARAYGHNTKQTEKLSIVTYLSINTRRLPTRVHNDDSRAQAISIKNTVYTVIVPIVCVSLSTSKKNSYVRTFTISPGFKCFALTLNFKTAA